MWTSEFQAFVADQFVASNPITGVRSSQSTDQPGRNERLETIVCVASLCAAA